MVESSRMLNTMSWASIVGRERDALRIPIELLTHNSLCRRTPLAPLFPTVLFVTLNLKIPRNAPGHLNGATQQLS